MLKHIDNMEISSYHIWRTSLNEILDILQNQVILQNQARELLREAKESIN